MSTVDQPGSRRRLVGRSAARGRQRAPEKLSPAWLVEMFDACKYCIAVVWFRSVAMRASERTDGRSKNAAIAILHRVDFRWARAGSPLARIVRPNSSKASGQAIVVVVCTLAAAAAAAVSFIRPALGRSGRRRCRRRRRRLAQRPVAVADPAAVDAGTSGRQRIESDWILPWVDLIRLAAAAAAAVDKEISPTARRSLFKWPTAAPLSEAGVACQRNEIPGSILCSCRVCFSLAARFGEQSRANRKLLATTTSPSSSSRASCALSNPARHN